MNSPFRKKLSILFTFYISDQGSGELTKICWMVFYLVILDTKDSDWLVNSPYHEWLG